MFKIYLFFITCHYSMDKQLSSVSGEQHDNWSVDLLAIFHSVRVEPIFSLSAPVP